MANITVTEIARLARVSIGTVDRALNDRPGINPATKARVLEIARAHNYRPNRLSKFLAKKRTVRLGVITLPTRSPFTRFLVRRLHATGAELSDLGLELRVCSLKELSGPAFAGQVQRLIDWGAEGLAVEGVMAPEALAAVDRAVADGVAVVTFNSDMPRTRRLCFVGQNLHQSGQVAADLLGRFLGGRGRVLVLHGWLGVQAHQERVDGFTVTLQADFPAIDIAAVIETEDDEDVAYERVRAWLQTHRDVQGVYVAATGSRGAGQAIAELGRAAEIRVVCNDVVPRTRALMQAGVIDATLLQDPETQGALPVRLLFDYVFEGKRPEQEHYYTRIDVITKHMLPMLKSRSSVV